MKIALVVPGGLHPSGREQTVPVWLSLLERLARTHEVHAFALQHLAKETSYPLVGAQVHDLGRPRGVWTRWRRFRAALREHGPFDLIHGFWVAPAGWLAVMEGRLLGVPTVVTCDSGEFTSVPDLRYGQQRTWRGRAMVAATCRAATRVHVSTRYMESLAAGVGVKATRVPLGVDRQRFAPLARPPDGPPWHLLQVASLNRVKDHAMLLDAVALMRRTLDVRLHLVGEDTLAGELQRRATALGVMDAVTWHGFVANDDLAPFHARAHVYVQSSRHEAGGIAVLEAAARGVPIVGTRVGYVSDWADEAAVAVRPGDTPALAEAVMATLRDPAGRRMRVAAAAKFVSTHDADGSARTLAALYEELT